jgi:hypothetical protein
VIVDEVVIVRAGFGARKRIASSAASASARSYHDHIIDIVFPIPMVPELMLPELMLPESMLPELMLPELMLLEPMLLEPMLPEFALPATLELLVPLSAVRPVTVTLPWVAIPSDMPCIAAFAAPRSFGARV